MKKTVSVEPSNDPALSTTVLAGTWNLRHTTPADGRYRQSMSAGGNFRPGMHLLRPSARGDASNGLEIQKPPPGFPDGGLSCFRRAAPKTKRPPLLAAVLALEAFAS
jgi:hypothetical protein